MKSILLFVLLAAVHLVAAFHCPPNVTQHLLDSNNQTYRYEVAIQNDSPYFLREIIMQSSSNVTVEGMNVSEAGIRFPFRALPPHKTHHWTYTHDSAEAATFDVVVAECVNNTRQHHNHHGNHTHSSNDTRPTVAPTANPSNETVPTASPTADPVPSESPTEAPNHTQSTHSANPTHRPARPTSTPTSNPTSGATSAPTSAPTSGASSTSSPTYSATSAPTSGSTSTSAPTAAPTSSATSAPTSAPTSSATSAPTAAATSAPTVPATSVTAAPTSNTTTTISGTCSGTPRMLDGKPCASTTRYWDGNLGACGCGDSSGAFSWVGSTYTAAASPPLFGTATDCGTGCGKCYQLTATGYSPSGTGATAGQTITVMVTNLCPAGGDWCASGVNSYDYGAHFDLADSPTAQLITNLGWDNPEVVYEEVSCSSTLASDFAECTCTSS